MALTIVVFAISVAQARIKAGAIAEVEFDNNFDPFRINHRKTDTAGICVHAKMAVGCVSVAFCDFGKVTGATAVRNFFVDLSISVCCFASLLSLHIFVVGPKNKVVTNS